MMTYALERWAIAQYNLLRETMDKINEEAFDKWWVDNYHNTVPFINGDWIISTDKNKKVCVIVNTKTNKIGVSKCSYGRQFRPAIGLGRCWAKCNDAEPPKFPNPVETKTIAELELHQVFSYDKEKLFEYVGKIEKSNSNNVMNKHHIGINLLTGNIHYFGGNWEAYVYSDEDVERIKKGLEPV